MMIVRCYWNLHKSCWSVQDAKTRRVIGHAKRILLREVAFTVSQAGRARVLEEGRKNVHAFACGQLEAAAWIEHKGQRESGFWSSWELTPRANNTYALWAANNGTFVSYNPRRDETFVSIKDEVRTPVQGAPMAYLATVPGKTKRAALLAFDPCHMTDAESARATE